MSYQRAVKAAKAKAKAMKNSKAPLGVCQWFLGCTNDATGTTPHPVLGNVPTCKRCNEFAQG